MQPSADVRPGTTIGGCIEALSAHNKKMIEGNVPPHRRPVLVVVWTLNDLIDGSWRIKPAMSDEF